MPCYCAVVPSPHIRDSLLTPPEMLGQAYRLLISRMYEFSFRSNISQRMGISSW